MKREKIIEEILYQKSIKVSALFSISFFSKLEIIQ